MSRPGQNTYYWTDQWTSVHLLTGAGFAYAGVPFTTTMALAVVYELFEQWLQRQHVGKTVFAISGPEVLGNVIVDLGAMAVGWWLVARARSGQLSPTLAQRLQRLP